MGLLVFNSCFEVFLIMNVIPVCFVGYGCSRWRWWVSRFRNRYSWGWRGEYLGGRGFGRGRLAAFNWEKACSSVWHKRLNLDHIYSGHKPAECGLALRKWIYGADGLAYQMVLPSKSLSSGRACASKQSMLTFFRKFLAGYLWWFLSVLFYWIFCKCDHLYLFLIRCCWEKVSECFLP